MKFSIIMSTRSNRQTIFERTLQSWERCLTGRKDYEFILIVNDNEKYDIEKLITKFSFPTEVKYQNFENVNRVWRREGMASRGDYVIYAMADEILGSYDLLDKMIENPKEFRTSINTYFLNYQQTMMLNSHKWQDMPSIIQEFAGFWEHVEIQDVPNKLRTSGGLITHVTGAWREYWDYVGWFRDDPLGYLLIDQDLVMREKFLQREVMSLECCYHQWHPSESVSMENRLGGYIYKTEREARLIDLTTLRAT